MTDEREQLAELFEQDDSDSRMMRRLALKVAGHNSDLHDQLERAIEIYETEAVYGRFIFKTINWKDK